MGRSKDSQGSLDPVTGQTYTLFLLGPPKEPSLRREKGWVTRETEGVGDSVKELGERTSKQEVCMGTSEDNNPPSQTDPGANKVRCHSGFVSSACPLDILHRCTNVSSFLIATIFLVSKSSTMY